METVTAMVGSIAGGNGGLTAGAMAPSQLRSLLAWWHLAGVDTAVAAQPAPWRATSPPVDEAPLTAASRPASRPPARPAARPAAAARTEPTLPAFTALADLVAWVEATTPGAVLADGNPDAGILLLGESPSAEDLATGRPFTGPAGQLLDRMLAAIGLDRTGCYITLLCPRRRIPGPPDPQDIARDLPLTRAHVRLAAPSAVLLLGGTPTQTLTASTTPISKLRGQPLALDADGHRPAALATFNPAYLLRRPADKALAWADLLAFRRMLAQGTLAR